MARVIVVSSGKGGVGKTTVTANIGRALGKMGLSVVLMDTDVGLNNLDVAMGIENHIVYDLVDVIENRCRIKQALIQDGETGSVYTMPSAHTYEQAKITGANIKYIISQLSDRFDYILLDCPAGIELGFHRAVAAASEAIVVTTPHISAIRDADKVINILKTYDIKSPGLIINRARGDLMLNYEMLGVDDIVNLLKLSPVGVIPESDDITTCNSTGGKLRHGSSAEFAFTLIAENIHKGTRKIYDCTHRFKGVFGRLKRNLKRLV